MATRRCLVLATIFGLVGGVLTHWEDWAAQLRGEMDPARIEEFLRILTEKPHMAGTQGGYELAEYVRRTWEDQGLDSAKIAPYDVLLSYPHPDSPSYVALLDESGSEIFRSSVAGEPQLDVDPPFNISGVPPPFAAYSPSGVVEGSLVYVNYARTSDFDLLKVGVFLLKGRSPSPGTERLREGASRLFSKFLLLQTHNVDDLDQASVTMETSAVADTLWYRGAIGMIVYSDPKEVVGTGSGKTKMYPDGWYAPGTAVQRGHYLYGVGEGEPLTPGYPATDYAYRIDQSDSDQLPTIPVHVLGYTDAMELLREFIRSTTQIVVGLINLPSQKPTGNLAEAGGEELQQPRRKSDPTATDWIPG
ncbi:hypothetical protein Bbelb_001040 [Branchiostoma belcheri]|nr:hypothetical protein Bbelb_001040 [Branchiostoma belcheri]